MKFTFFHWIILFCLVILASVCILKAIRLFSVEYPITKREQFIRSVKTGGFLAAFMIIVVFIVGILIWAETGVFKSIVLSFPMLCIIPLIVIMGIVGTYIQFFWYGRLSKYKDDLISRQVEKYESDDQGKIPK